MSPDASGGATCPECARAADHPDTSRQPTNHPGRPPPGHSASAPRVNPPGSEFSVKSRKFQKMVLTSKIHRNSSLNRKNPKPVFTVSFLQDLTNKIDRS